MFQDFAVKVWVDINNFLPVRQQINIKYSPTSNVPGSTESGDNQMAMDMNASLNYYDFGESVIIQLPADALNAE